MARHSRHPVRIKPCRSDSRAPWRPGSPGARVVLEPQGHPQVDGETIAVITLRQQRVAVDAVGVRRSEEHTSELQSLMRISYAVFCLKKKNHYTRSTKPK